MNNQLRIIMVILFCWMTVICYAQPSQIFWADKTRNKIQSAYLNGWNVTDVAVDVQIPEGIAIDTTVNPMKVYYCEKGLNRIMKMNFDGSDQEEVVTEISGLRDIDLDLIKRKVFWLSDSYDDDRVMSADMDSLNSNVTDIYKSTYAMHDFRGIALDPIHEKVYWSNTVYGAIDKISRINYNGTNRDVVARVYFPHDIDIIGDKLYWIRGGNDLLYRSNLTCTYSDTLITNFKGHYFAMDTSLGMAFWTESKVDIGYSKIMRGKLDNTEVKEIVTGTGNSLAGIALYFNPDFNTTMDPEPAVVNNFQLFQNYPNPFNPITAISYQLPAFSKVELSIYNLLGEKIATLVSAKQPAGNYEVQWDASGMASGVYLYKLTTNQGFMQTRKLVLLK